MAESEGVYLW